MNLIVIGINHKTAPVEIREKFSFSSKQTIEANYLLKKNTSLAENVILSTCNRVEIYAVADRNSDSVNTIKSFLSQFHNLNLSDYENRMYIHKDKEVVEHLFGVTAGLDSMVLGEMEIVSQVKKAYQDARESRSTGKVLNRLFEKAFNAAKQIRTETLIGRGPVSVSSAAVRLAEKILGELTKKTVMIIGTGTIGEQLISYFSKNGIQSTLVANRTFEKANALAARFAATAVTFDDFKARLAEVDIVVASTGAPHCIIHHDDIMTLMPQRKQKPLFIIDLAVPRDVEADVNKIDNVYLYDIDDLEKIVNENINIRKSQLDGCSAIINTAAERFMAWLASEKIRDEPR